MIAPTSMPHFTVQGTAEDRGAGGGGTDSVRLAPWWGWGRTEAQLRWCFKQHQSREQLSSALTNGIRLSLERVGIFRGLVKLNQGLMRHFKGFYASPSIR